MALEIQDLLDEVGKLRPLAALLPPPANGLALVGISLAEELIAFVKAEDVDKVVEQLRAVIRAGVKASIETEFEQRYPRG